MSNSVMGARAPLNGSSAGQYPPGSNTGGNSHDGSLAIVDTLTFTLALDHLTDDVAVTCMHDRDALARALDKAFLRAMGFTLGESTRRRINGYKDSAALLCPAVDDDTNGDTNFGYVAWGGNPTKIGQDTLCVHLTGQACEHLNLLGGKPWHTLVGRLERHGAKVTRLDVAHDDLTGSRGGVDAAVAAYHEGAFTIRRPPSISNAGDWINGHSRTLYVGKRENGKLIRVYEKGHQLGDPESRWVRYELELHSRDRVIEPAAILDPAGVLAGGSPFLEALMASVEPVKVKTIVRQRLRVTMDHLIGCGRVAYGRLINAMSGLGMTPEEVVKALRVEGLPARLYVPPAACAA